MIDLGKVTGTVPALVASSSGAAVATGLGKSKGRVRLGYAADALVGGNLAEDLTALRAAGRTSGRVSATTSWAL